MFLNQSQMNHHQDSVSNRGLINSIPGNQINQTVNQNHSSIGRSLLSKPIGFVSNHRRSASLSGLVSRNSTRRNKSRPVSTVPPLETTEEHTQEAHPSPQEDPQLTNSINPTQPALHSTLPRLRTSLTSSQSNNQTPTHLTTLSIIQPRSAWSPSYEVDRRCFRINLNHPRQQVTSLLALSSIPRPVTPPFDDERENTTRAIMNATRTAIEEEAIRAAIAASIETENRRIINHWADHQKSCET